MKAKSRASGMVAATISPERRSNRKKISTTTTRRMPRSRLSSTARVVRCDQVAAVVERVDLHVLRQDAVVQLPRLRLDALQHRLRLLAGAHQDDAFHGVVLVVEPELAEARGAWPISTVATSFTSTGMPFFVAMTTLPMSVVVLRRASPRT